MQRALEVADRLAAEGIEIEVIDPRTLVPLDIETVHESVRRTGRLLVCHEAPERGGWAADVAAMVTEVCFDHLDAPPARVCGANLPIPYSTPMEDAVLPGAAAIEGAARELIVGVRVQARTGHTLQVGFFESCGFEGRQQAKERIQILDEERRLVELAAGENEP